MRFISIMAALGLLAVSAIAVAAGELWAYTGLVLRCLGRRSAGLQQRTGRVSR